MSVPARIASAALLLTALVWSIGLVWHPGRFASSAAVLIGGDHLLLALVAVAGLLLTPSRWPRALALGLVVFEAALLPARTGAGWVISSLAAAVLAAAVLAGPWLGRHVRRMPSADGPPPRVVLLMLGLLATPTAAGLAAPAGLRPAHWVFAAVALGVAWSYGRAMLPALYALRFAFPAAGAAAALSSPLAGGIALAGYTAGLVALAWTREARLSVAPLAPTRVPTYRMPPELVPPEVLRAAGYDEHGRPLRRSP